MFFADDDTPGRQALRSLRCAYHDVEETPARFHELIERLRDAAAESPVEVAERPD